MTDFVPRLRDFLFEFPLVFCSDLRVFCGMELEIEGVNKGNIFLSIDINAFPYRMHIGEKSLLGSKRTTN